MEKAPFGPKALNAANNDASPDFASGLNKGNRTNIRKVDRVENFWKGSKEAPLPCRTPDTVFPEKPSVFVGCME
jgi:hypothetical protein